MTSKGRRMLKNRMTPQNNNNNNNNNQMALKLRLIARIVANLYSIATLLVILYIETDLTVLLT